MNYLYYPGCSLEGTALEYNTSTKRFLQEVGVNLQELDGWTCCGATAADAISPLLSLALPARNLALAEKMDGDKDIIIPCSACYLNLKKVEEKIKNDHEILIKINEILKENQLKLSGKVRARHLLDILSKDLGPQIIKSRLKRALTGFRIAPYYGCQCLRPYPIFDDPESPSSMEPLIKATGAEIHSWKMGGKCCGASHMNTKMEVALELTGAILKGAQGADAIVTVCPMCQMNLEAYQDKISRTNQMDLRISILYLPQLLGLAIGLSKKDLRMDLNLAITRAFHEKLNKTNIQNQLF